MTSSTSYFEDGRWFDASGKLYRDQTRASDPEFREFVDAMIRAGQSGERRITPPNVEPSDYPDHTTLHVNRPSPD